RLPLPRDRRAKGGGRRYGGLAGARERGRQRGEGGRSPRCSARRVELMARKRRFSDDTFGPTVERLMKEGGVTYPSLAEKTRLSAGYLNPLVHGNRPVPPADVIEPLARALGVEAEHFREYRLRVITDRLERMPDLIDKLYRRYGT